MNILTRIRFLIPVLLLAASGHAGAQEAPTVTVQVVVKHARVGKDHGSIGNENVVVWLKSAAPAPVSRTELPHFRMQQKNKQFHPHVLALPVGAAVEFPNDDPFFHNVFSLYKGKRFDLGLYEAGRSRTVRFERPGVSFVFCNIHPQMSAYVVALETPYYAVSDARGQVTIPNVPPGRYRLEVWYERAESSELAKLSRDVVVEGPNPSLGAIEVPESVHFVPPHTDKHGRPYDADHTPY
jgi:plastocyanin